MSAAWAVEIVKPVGVGTIDRVEGGAGTMVVLIAMLILFGAATYFTTCGFFGSRTSTTVKPLEKMCPI